MNEKQSSIAYLISTTGRQPDEISEWDKARSEYEHIINQSDAKEQLLKLVIDGVANIDDSIYPKRIPKSQDPSINVFYNGKTFTFQADENNQNPSKIKPFTFGILEWNDIKAISLSYISRCHLIVIPIYERSIIIIADFASLGGTKIHYRTSNGPYLSSTKDKKNLLIFDWDEIVEIHANLNPAYPAHKLIFGPKMCLVCFQKARTKAFKCNENNGHLVACEDCINDLDQCPLCHSIAPIEHISSPFQTMVSFI